MGHICFIAMHWLFRVQQTKALQNKAAFYCIKSWMADQGLIHQTYDHHISYEYDHHISYENDHHISYEYHYHMSYEYHYHNSSSLQQNRHVGFCDKVTRFSAKSKK